MKRIFVLFFALVVSSAALASESVATEGELRLQCEVDITAALAGNPKYFDKSHRDLPDLNQIVWDAKKICRHIFATQK